MKKFKDLSIEDNINMVDIIITLIIAGFSSSEILKLIKYDIHL